MEYSDYKNSLSHQKKNSIIFLCDVDNCYNFLNKDIEAITINILFTKFLPNKESILYTFNSLINTYILRSIIYRNNVYDTIKTSNELLVTCLLGSNLKVFINEDIETADHDEEFFLGWKYTVSKLLESAIFNQSAPQSSFSVDVFFMFEGLLHL